MPEEEAFDLDEFFSYDTIKEVRVLDRRLGLVYYFVLGMVVFYIVIFCLILNQQYLAEEKTNGFMMTKVLNPSFANASDDGTGGLPFDVFEAFSNPGESGALFIPTRAVVTRGQSQAGECAHPTFPCKGDGDCDTGEAVAVAKCEAGSCVRRGWCPPEQLGAPATEVHKVDAKAFNIWFQGKVQYHLFKDLDGNGLSLGNMGDPVPIISPAENAQTYNMWYILEMAKVRLEDIWQDGAVMLLTAKFDCDLDAVEDACVTNIEGATVDVSNGFNYKVASYYNDGDDRKRTLYHFFGIRLVVFSMGLGKRADFTQSVLVLSQAIALLSCAGTVADVFLQYMVPERKHYIEQKIKQTEDFGDNDK